MTAPTHKAASRPANARRHLGMVVAAVLLLGAAPPTPPPPRFAHWIDGTTATEPETQVQMIDPETFAIRQSVRTNFEAPFLYLLFGRDRALLLDTGAGGLKIRPAIDRVIDAWRARHHGRPIHLVVAHLGASRRRASSTARRRAPISGAVHLRRAVNRLRTMISHGPGVLRIFRADRR